MIAAVLARLGIPLWGAVVLACVLALGAALAYRTHLVEQGAAIEAARRDAIDAANAQRARDALALANARTRAAQVRLDSAMASLTSLYKEFSDEQSNSAALQSELAAGRRRLSILTVRERLLRPDPITVPPLPAWIREPRLRPISTDEWQAILNGRGRPAMKPLSGLTPVSPLTKP